MAEQETGKELANEFALKALRAKEKCEDSKYGHLWGLKQWEMKEARDDCWNRRLEVMNLLIKPQKGLSQSKKRRILKALDNLS
jgi:hypothetical protein